MCKVLKKSYMLSNVYIYQNGLQIAKKSRIFASEFFCFVYFQKIEIIAQIFRLIGIRKSEEKDR